MKLIFHMSQFQTFTYTVKKDDEYVCKLCLNIEIFFIQNMIYSLVIDSTLQSFVFLSIMHCIVNYNLIEITT